ncbi:MAG TPA: hypothetical protein VGG25_24310 [Streptosporangiaceae bacterium]|jgi:hypothetical protein
MTSPDTSQDEPGNPGPWLEQVAASLAAGGLPGRVAQAAGEASLTITVARPGRRDTEVIVDGDGYCELRWWLAPHHGPGQAAAVITAALHAAHAPAAAS